jgi:hypothetical protein
MEMINKSSLYRCRADIDGNGKMAHGRIADSDIDDVAFSSFPDRSQ